GIAPLNATINCCLLITNQTSPTPFAFEDVFGRTSFPTLFPSIIGGCLPSIAGTAPTPRCANTAFAAGPACTGAAAGRHIALQAVPPAGDACLTTNPTATACLSTLAPTNTPGSSTVCKVSETVVLPPGTACVEGQGNNIMTSAGFSFG